MSFERLLSEDRRLFVWYVFSEMHNNAMVNESVRGRVKAYFLRLVEGNEELSEIEKQFCREKFIYWFELENARDKSGKPRKCKKCKKTRYSDRFCERCISLHLRSLFNTWTSGNEIINNFIHQCQILSSLPNRILEWVPFDQFEEVTKLTEGGGFSSISANWTRGSIDDYDESKKEFIYHGTHSVALKSLNNSSNPGSAFFNEVII